MKKINIKANLDNSQFMKQLQNLLKKQYKIDVGVNADKVKDTTDHVNNLNKSVNTSNGIFGKLGNTISNTFSAGKVAMTSYLIVLNEIRKAGQEAKKSIEDINRAVTDLQIATDLSRESVEGLVKDYNQYGKQLASTTTQITSAADDYLRAGKTLNESQALIKDSIMLSKLGKLDSGAATEDLLAVMNGYNMSVEEVGKSLDAMVAIDMKAATSAGDIATALKYSASSADLAGLSFNKLAGMIATVQDKTQQSAETVGTFMNTMLSRYRNVKIGQFVDDDGEDLSDVETILNSLNIKIRDTNQEFRNFEPVIDEVAQKWDEYSSVQQAAIAKAFSGTRQQNRFLALMDGYSKTLDLTAIAAESAGTAVDKFNNSYMTSLEGKKNTLQNSFESMIINSDSEEVYAGIVEATTALIDFINQTNALKGAFASLTVVGGIKAFLSIRTGINEAYLSLNKFQNALQITKQTQISTNDFDKLLLLSNGLSSSQTKLLLSSKNLTLTQKEQLLMSQGLSQAEAKLQLQTWGMTTAQNGLTAATTTLGNAFKGLFASMIANPILMVTMAISGAVMAYQSYNQKLEESRRKNIEASETAIEHANSLKDLYNEYTRLSSIQNRTSSEEESFKTVVEDVTKALGAKADILEGITAGTKEYAEALAKATKEELQSASINATIGRKSAEEELQGKVWSDWKGSKVSIDSNGKGKALSDEAQKAVGIVSDALKDFETVNRTWDNLSWDISSNKPEEALQFYNSLLKAREELVLASENDEELLNTEIYRDLNSSINTMEESLDSYISKRYEEEKLNYMAQHGIPQTTDQYENMKKSILNTASASDGLKTKFGELLASDFSNLSIQMNDVAQGMDKIANNNTLSISSTIDQLNTQLKPAFDSLKTSYQDIFTSDGFTLENVDLDVLSNVQSVMNEMKEAGLDIDTSGFENLAKVLSNSSSTAEQVQGVFDSLASSILNNTDTIKNLDDSTADLVTSMLESLGVANAEEIVYDSLNAKTEALALQKQFAAETGYELVNATTDEITAFLNHAGASETARQYLFQLVAAEQVFNAQGLDVGGKIAKLKELATAYGQTAIAARISNMEKANTDGHISIDYAKELSSLQNEINGAINNVKVDFKGIGGGAKSASKAGKETADAYLDAYKKELSELDHLHEMGIISEREYFNRLNALNEKYFNDNAEHQKKYLSEYQSNQEKVYKGLQSLYKELLNDQKDGYDSALSAINKFYDGEINKLNNLKDASKDSYQSQIDDIDKKISRLEKERDTRKKAIQDQIDAIKEENEELDRQKALEDALYEAKRAQTQKSRVYKNGQAEYDTDSKAISKTADTVDKTKDDIKLAELEKELDSLDDYYDNLISSLESQQDALKEKMDAVTASYESQIKQLEANQQKYADIATAQEDSENKMMATALLGSNWQQLILSGRLDVLDAFKGSYLGICDEISNADTTFGLDASTAAEGYAQSISDMLVKTTSLETLLQSWKDLNTGLSGVIGVGGSSGKESSTSNGKSEKSQGNTSSESNTNADTITGAVQGGGEQIADTLANQWVPAWQDVGNNMNDICGGIVSSVNEMASSVVNSCKQAINAINMANAAKNSSSSSNPTPSFNGSTYTGKRYAKGTDNAKKGINLIGEDEYELYEDNKGNISLATEPTLINMQGGEKVTNHEDTKKILSETGTKSPCINQEALKKLFEYCGEPDENGMIKLKPLESPVLSEQIKNIASLYNPVAMAMQSFMPKLPNYSNIATARSQAQDVKINIGDIRLEGVQNTDQLARGIVSKFPNRILQAMYDGD